MNTWNRLKLLRQMLTQGLLVEWAYSFVVILVIAALFSTPLILGSIKNRVYVAVKQQVEKENNAREITIQQNDNVPLNRNFVNDLNSKYPAYKAIGNLKSVVMIEGTIGAQIQTLQTLVLDDPRNDALHIRPKPKKLGFFDVVVSDQLGELLYGKEKWYGLWEASLLSGKPLKLTINDIPLEGEFRIVARQKAPGHKIYASEALGVCLKKYSIGLGCEKVGLPMVADQVQYSLPRFETLACHLDFSKSQCDADQQAKILKRLKAENFKVQGLKSWQEDINHFQVRMTKLNEVTGRVEASKGHCEQRLSHHLQACPSVAITPIISLEVGLVESETIHNIHLSGISPASYELLPGIEEMANQWGGRPMNFWMEGLLEHGIEIVAPYDENTPMGPVTLQIANNLIPGFITAYYKCSEGMKCPFYAKSDVLFRLQNMVAGSAILKHENGQPVFYPSETQQRIDYDEVFIYASQVEEVEGLYQALTKALPGYNVQYNIYAIDKLKLQDQRLSTLFRLTLWLSVIFIILAVGALAKINIDKRRREMAQLFLLGYGKLFVSIVLVSEYLLLTVLASLLAIGVGWGIFSAAGYYLQSSLGDNAAEFETIVNAMSLDLGAFSIVFLIVISLTTLVASIAALWASKSDPVELLD